MKRLLPLLIAAISITLAAQEAPTLRFRPDGTLKIVQFTDIHYKYGRKASRAATEMMDSVLEAEQPDFVIITGDLVYADGVAQALPEIVAPIVGRELPWAAVFGNHDHQFDMTLPQIYDALQAMPGCLMPPRPDSIDSPDYAIDLLAAGDSSRTVGTLYCLDSHAAAPIKGVGRYAWLNYDQVGWYRAESRRRTLAAGAPLPSLMFMHIPLPEYTLAQADPKAFLLGTAGEAVCQQGLNSGMFCAIKEMADVFAVVCGHDHDNDFVTDFYGVMLAYGRYSGGKTVYNHLGLNGARVLVLHEGQPRLDTWLRLRDGSVVYATPFPFRK